MITSDWTRIDANTEATLVNCDREGVPLHGAGAGVCMGNYRRIAGKSCEGGEWGLEFRFKAIGFISEMGMLDEIPVPDIKPFAPGFDHRQGTRAGWREIPFGT